MTCIATNGRVMAADGRLHRGGRTTSDRMVKIGHAKDGSVVGVAGTAGSIPLVLRWFAKGEPDDALPTIKIDEDGEPPFEALILRPDGRVEGLDNDFAAFVEDVPAAIGSGALPAIAAMRCGRSPSQAIILAAQLVPTVGGEITQLRPKKRRSAK